MNSLQRSITLSVAAGPVSRRAKYDTKSLPDSALDLQEKTLQYGDDGLPYTMLSQVTRRGVVYGTKGDDLICTSFGLSDKMLHNYDADGLTCSLLRPLNEVIHVWPSLRIA